MELYLLGRLSQEGRRGWSEEDKKVEETFEKVYVERGHVVRLLDLLVEKAKTGVERWAVFSGSLKEALEKAGADVQDIPFDGSVVGRNNIESSRIIIKRRGSYFYNYETFLAFKLGEIVVSDGGYYEKGWDHWTFYWGEEGKEENKDFSELPLMLLVWFIALPLTLSAFGAAKGFDTLVTEEDFRCMGYVWVGVSFLAMLGVYLNKILRDKRQRDHFKDFCNFLIEAY